MAPTPQGYISFAEAIGEMWRRVWPDGATPSLSFDECSVPEVIVGKAHPRIRSIAETIAWGLSVRLGMVAVYQAGDGSLRSTQDRYWQQPNATASALAGRIFTKNLGSDFWRGVPGAVDWESIDGRPTFIGKSSWQAWLVEVFGRDISAWIPAPAAFRLAGILSGEGKAKAKTRMLYMFRDGLMTARGEVRKDDGPHHVMLESSWWIDLTYREAANAVWKRDNRLYAHTDDEGRPVAPRTPAQMAAGERADNVEVMRSDVHVGFGSVSEVLNHPVAGSDERHATKTAPAGPGRGKKPNEATKRKILAVRDAALDILEKHPGADIGAIVAELHRSKRSQDYNDKTLEQIISGIYPTMQRYGITKSIFEKGSGTKAAK